MRLLIVGVLREGDRGEEEKAGGGCRVSDHWLQHRTVEGSVRCERQIGRPGAICPLISKELHNKYYLVKLQK